MADVRTFGAVGDGVTNDTAAINLALASWDDVISFPGGNYCVTPISVPPGKTLLSDKPGTSLTLAPGWATGRLLNLAGDNRLIGLTLNGNRRNLASPLRDGAAALNVSGPNITVENVEIKESPYCGAFIGSNTVVCSRVSFNRCYIHDNGGVTADVAIGDGIYSGGTMLPEGLLIENCLFENNHATVTLGDSCAMNLSVANGAIVRNNIARNNYNVSGGQIAVVNYSGSATIDAVVQGNICIRTGSFQNDRTNGIEVQGRGFSVVGNVVEGCVFSGIGIVGQWSGFGAVTGNTVRSDVPGSAGIAFYGDPRVDNSSDIVVSGNFFRTPISTQLLDANRRIGIFGNYFQTSPSTKDPAWLAARSIVIANNLFF
jgi:hypothetical protein